LRFKGDQRLRLGLRLEGKLLWRGGDPRPDGGEGDERRPGLPFAFFIPEEFRKGPQKSQEKRRDDREEIARTELLAERPRFLHSGLISDLPRADGLEDQSGDEGSQEAAHHEGGQKERGAVARPKEKEP
jgi:hypothetical protein